MREDLPPGRYHDLMIPLGAERRAKAAAISVREIKKYPPRYLEKIGLKAFGVFEACVSRTGDGFRPFDRELGGYRYYGIWNGENGVAGAYYSDSQLPLTLHHEVFHHIDGTHAGRTSYTQNFASDDARFTAAVSGDRPYAALQISAADRELLRRAARGNVLRGAVSDYAAKAAGEDQAETARHFMTNLADSLLQAAEQPELAGSQRILHILTQYSAALEGEATPAWFLDLALNRPHQTPAAEPAEPPTPAALLVGLAKYCEAVPVRENFNAAQQTAREALEAFAALDAQSAKDAGGENFTLLAARTTGCLMQHRIQPGGEGAQFVIWGGEDADGVNWTLRADLATFAADSARLAKLSANTDDQRQALTRTQLGNLRRLAAYFVWIDRQWRVTGGTREAFVTAKNGMIASLPAEQAELAAELAKLDFSDLALRLPADGAPKLLPITRAARTNAYLPKVDAEISDAARRAALRGVQPACVRVGGASGVCLSADGYILTAAHVPDRLGQKQVCTFPDGSEYTGSCVAINSHLDLAIVKIEASGLPFAPLAAAAPAVGDWVCCIGQPGRYTPGGEATGYQPFHVSSGKIRGFLENPLGSQALGRAKHDAWTYWGHSGSPLFNSAGEIVAMHNSWDSNTAMRHAVPYEAIVHFLKEARIPYRTGG